MASRWMEWVGDYVDTHLTVVGTAQVSGVNDRHAAGDDDDRSAFCDQCDAECDNMCPYCGAGLHSAAHTERHGTATCVGEDHWPAWLKRLWNSA